MTAAPAAVAPLPEIGRTRALVDFYATTMRIAVQEQLQYRVQNYLYMLGMVAEPLIYLVVWTTIAEQRGGSVEGVTAGQFAAYYIVWTLVRNMNIVFTPYGWEWRIREGMFSGQLLRPLHPLHYDVAYFAGWKFVVIVLWLPIAFVLSLVFDPTFAIGWLDVVVFAFAVWGAYLIRTMFLELLGMISFWTTRVSAIFELAIAAELLLSGRLVPLQVMPDWAQQVAAVLPFQWTFYFPIQALVGDLSTGELLGGLAMQAVWIVALTSLLAFVFRVAVKRYAAVGN
jgi:ABC-2 type transport system permease protein